MIRLLAWSAFLAAVVTAASVEARVLTGPVRLPVDHPCANATRIRTPANWRVGVEKSAEEIVRLSLQMRKFEVIELKLPGNHGVDLLAFKKNALGEWTDLRLLEVKGHHGEKPTVRPTKVGYLMDRRGLIDWRRKLHARGNEGRRLARNIFQFCRSRGLDIARLGELHDVNFRTGSYTVRHPITLAVRMKPMPLGRLLNSVAKSTTDPIRRQYALRHASQLSRIQSSSMGRWLVETVPGYGPARGGPKPVARSVRPRSFSVGRTMVRSVGRAVVVVAVAMDAYELYGHVAEYRAGRISKRRLVTSLAASSGGISAAWAGGAGGAWIGVKIGAFGGPVAWVTVPVGAVVGGAVGGVAGYLSGSAAGEAAANLWYGSLDEPVRIEIGRWIVATPNPFGD